MKKKHKKPTYADYLQRCGEAHAQIWQNYNSWKTTSPKEPIGTARPLNNPETIYFNFLKTYYESLPTIRERPHYFSFPPKTWKARLLNCNHPTTETFRIQLDSLNEFSMRHCQHAQRNNWNKVLPADKLPFGSLERLLWALAFLKTTNGVADKVSCGHFLKLIQNKPNLSIESYNDPYFIASLIRQTSKWVKNTFVIVNIFRHIKEQWNSLPSENFHDWINFYEIGPKTAALLFHAAFNQAVTLPVDSHVWHAFKAWNWTNAKSPDECSWQAYNWMPPEYFIKTNDTIGSIRQSIAEKSKTKRILRLANQLPPDIKQLILSLSK